MRTFGTWIFVGVLAGCTSVLGPTYLQSMTAKAVGCEAREVKTSQQEAGQVIDTLRWRAECDGRTYACSRVGSGAPVCLPDEPST